MHPTLCTDNTIGNNLIPSDHVTQKLFRSAHLSSLKKNRFSPVVDVYTEFVNATPMLFTYYFGWPPKGTAQQPKPWYTCWKKTPCKWIETCSVLSNVMRAPFLPLKIWLSFIKSPHCRNNIILIYLPKSHLNSVFGKIYLK